MYSSGQPYSLVIVRAMTRDGHVHQNTTHNNFSRTEVEDTQALKGKEIVQVTASSNYASICSI